MIDFSIHLYMAWIFFCPRSLLLTEDTWKTVLESEGFRYVSFMAEQSHQLGQQIIAAESNGVVRQKKRTGAEEDPSHIQMNVKCEYIL